MPDVDPAQEYSTLRAELLEAKRYVFERPLAIAGVAAVGLQAKNEALLTVLPLVVGLLTLFNFSFTVNRLQSASRISAYIQLVLEKKATLRWIGWESSLRIYRIWLKQLIHEKKLEADAACHIQIKWLKELVVKERANELAAKYVDRMIECDAVPDALIYYPMIYRFHLALAGSSIIASIFEITHLNLITQTNQRIVWLVNLAAILVELVLIPQFFKRRPGRIRDSIERNIAIWKEAFDLGARESPENPD